MKLKSLEVMIIVEQVGVKWLESLKQKYYN